MGMYEDCGRVQGLACFRRCGKRQFSRACLAQVRPVGAYELHWLGEVGEEARAGVDGVMVFFALRDDAEHAGIIQNSFDSTFLTFPAVERIVNELNEW